MCISVNVAVCVFVLFSIRCFAVPPCVRGAVAAPLTDAFWSLVEDGTAGEGKVWSHRFSHLSPEELHPKEAGQCILLGCSGFLEERCFSKWCQQAEIIISDLLCQGAEIQRVWSLHDVLTSLEYASENNKQIIDSLLQFFHHPTHIRNDDVSAVSCYRSCDFVLKLSVWLSVSCHRENDSWCFFSAGTLTLSGLSTVPLKTSWSFITSKMGALYSLTAANTSKS